MAIKKYLHYLSFSLTFLFLVCAASAAEAKLKDASAALAVERVGVEESYQIAARGLVKKMETDLVLSDIKVKFAQVERYAVSKSQIGLRGAGTCQLSGEKTELPIQFDVKINASSKNVTDIQYNFVDAEAAAADDDPAATTMTEDENFVTRQLLEKIKADFKTENIVLAIDFLNDKETSNAAKMFTGEGEIRLGDLVWKKISFEVVPNVRNSNAAAQVSYKIQE
jgi:hypothetical protein